MLAIKTPDELATRLGLRTRQLLWTLDHADELVELIDLSPPGEHGKSRRVTSAKGPLRAAQRLFYERVLLPALAPSPHSFGGVRGRSARMNAARHLGQSFLYTTDISQFFPTIHHERVRNLFLVLGCSRKAAGLCTRLVTHDARLAQGFSTSSILADRMLAKVDADIAEACGGLGLVYTRFVDDIAVSGGFDFGRSGVPGVIRRIVRGEGFRLNGAKERHGSLAAGKAAVTGVRAFDGRLDVTAAYHDELVRRLEDHAALGAGTGFAGPYCTPEQLWGRIGYACSLNPNRRRPLMALLGKIDWDIANDNARLMGLIAPTPPAGRQARTKTRADGPATASRPRPAGSR